MSKAGFIGVALGWLFAGLVWQLSLHPQAAKIAIVGIEIGILTGVFYVIGSLVYFDLIQGKGHEE